MKNLIFLSILLSATAVRAQTACEGDPNAPISEPAFCSQIVETEVPATLRKKIGEKLHVFTIGSVTVAGYPVGKTKIEDSQQLAALFSGAGTQDKFCTWYLNDNSEAAKRTFRYTYVPNPRDVPYEQAASEFMRVLAPEMTGDTGFFQCASQYRYIGIGCHGMEHRGPTGFAMLLAFAGCRPERANAMTNQLWDLNGVKEPNRLGIVNEAYRLGRCYSSSSKRLADLFSASPTR